MSIDNAAAGVTPTRRGAKPPGGATTFDLFSWSEGPDVTRSPPPPVRPTATNGSSSNAFLSAVVDQSTCDSPVGRPTIRMHQPAGGTSTITFGEHLSAEEAEALLKRRPGSDLKKREMYGSGIFPGGAGADADGNGTTATVDRTSVRCYQPAGGVSQISFGGENCASPKKAVTVPEVAKQKELSGTVETTDDITARRVFSNAKAKELTGSNIFGPPPPESPKPSARALELRREEAAKGPEEAPPRNVHTSVKVSNPAGGRCQISFGPKDEIDSVARKLHDQKKAELSGHDIFSEENAMVSEKSLHHQLSQAKLKEISGSDIFSDDKPAGRDLIGGIRKPPGGGSTISLQ